MMYQAYVAERGVDPRQVRDTDMARETQRERESTGAAARQVFAELEQQAEAQERGPTPPGGGATSRSVAERIAERQRQA
eukprot:COSAG03_NODE_16720_length_393_cov_30.040816_1_plen_78_part_10